MYLTVNFLVGLKTWSPLGQRHIQATHRSGQDKFPQEEKQRFELSASNTINVQKWKICVFDNQVLRKIKVFAIELSKLTKKMYFYKLFLRFSRFCQITCAKNVEQSFFRKGQIIRNETERIHKREWIDIPHISLCKCKKAKNGFCW